MLKYSNFFGEIFYSILHISAQFIKKYKAYTRVDLKIGTKSGVENFIGTKSRKWHLEGLKWKVDIFLKGPKTYFVLYFIFSILFWKILYLLYCCYHLLKKKIVVIIEKIGIVSYSMKVQNIYYLYL